MRRFRYGWGTFKMDWALAGPVPWSAAEARQAAVVHAGDSVADLAAFTRQVAPACCPTNPYLVIGQQSLPTRRAPAGGHTLWAYSRVPSSAGAGGANTEDRFRRPDEAAHRGAGAGLPRADPRPGAIHARDDLEAMDENLVGGDLGGGSARFDQQLFFRPVFPYFRYRTPVTRAVPGVGVGAPRRRRPRRVRVQRRPASFGRLR